MVALDRVGHERYHLVETFAEPCAHHVPVGVLGVGGGVQRRRQRSSHFHRRGEGLGGEDEGIATRGVGRGKVFVERRLEFARIDEKRRRIRGMVGERIDGGTARREHVQHTVARTGVGVST